MHKRQKSHQSMYTVQSQIEVGSIIFSQRLSRHLFPSTYRSMMETCSILSRYIRMEMLKEHCTSPSFVLVLYFVMKHHLFSRRTLSLLCKFFCFYSEKKRNKR